MKYVVVLVGVALSGSALAGIIEPRCSGAVYDTRADMIRNVYVDFASGKNDGHDFERAIISFSDENLNHSIIYGLGDCTDQSAGSLSCSARSETSEPSLPSDLTFIRTNSSMTFTEEAGLRGRVPCVLTYSYFDILDVKYNEIPQRPGDPISFSVDIKQDRIQDIEECWAQVTGFRDGRKLAGVYFHDCSVEALSGGMKRLTFRDITSTAFTAGHYYLEFVSHRAVGDAEGESSHGWAFKGFDVAN